MRLHATLQHRRYTKTGNRIRLGDPGLVTGDHASNPSSKSGGSTPICTA